ncbi:hypothetical protein [Neorhizobium sp. T7_12]|uniref:hypothetical protein n=1 Tax=Neorhizobium sp. T7_12 TaxID=2093832 RepID=UPI00155EF400|nr:hypothetical protein [Neorhizobium sp. T7_12]
MTIVSFEAARNLEGVNIFVDTNVLLFVDGAHAFEDRERAYSDIYFHLGKKNKLFTSEKCLGEFSNRLTKLYYDMDKDSDPQIGDFKRYRKSKEFSQSMECIYDATCQFLDDLEIIKSYENIDIKNAFLNVKTGLIDYPDIVAARICLKDDMYFFSDDGDAIFCKGLKVITNNRWALSKINTRHNIECL